MFILNIFSRLSLSLNKYKGTLERFGDISFPSLADLLKKLVFINKSGWRRGKSIPGTFKSGEKELSGKKLIRKKSFKGQTNV